MTATRKSLKTAHKPLGASASKGEAQTTAKPSKLDLIVGRLSRPGGASLAELVAATGWQAHSVRGALAGSLKKKGHAIISERVDGERRYRIGQAR